MEKLITPAQIKEEHPEWTDEQITAEFDKLTRHKIIDAISLIKSYSSLLKNDPLLKDLKDSKEDAEFIDNEINGLDFVFNGLSLDPLTPWELKQFDLAIEELRKNNGKKCLMMDFDNTLFNTDSRRDAFGHWLKGFPESSIPGYKLYDGWREVLSWAQENNVKTAIISTTPEDHIKKALDRFGLKVDAICGKIRKNSGRPLRDAAVDLDVALLNTLYVGDHAKDADIARMAGVPFAGALWDSWHEGQLAARKCFTISSPSEIIGLFDHLSDIPKPIRVAKADDPRCSMPTPRRIN